MNKYFIINLLFFCLVCQSATNPSSGNEKIVSGGTGVSGLVDKADKLISDSKYKPAMEMLEKALLDARLAGIARGHATVLLARAQRLDGTPAKSILTLQKLIETKDPMHYVEMAEAYLALSKPDEAVRSASSYGTKDTPDVLTYANWVTARAEFAIEHYLRCIDSCKGTLSEIGKYRLKSDADKKTLEEFVVISKEAYELMEKAQEMYDSSTYGADYANYRKARRAEFKGNYDDAIKYYSRIRKGILYQAASLYIGKCHAVKGEDKEAIKRFKEIIEKDPSSPYAGEAYLEITENAYVRSGAEEALKHIEQFDAWAVNEEKASTAQKELDGINAALMTDIVEKAPKKYLDADDYGNLVRTARMPESIINGRTSPWYLPYLKTRAGIYKGHLVGETSDNKVKAGEIFKTLPLIGGQMKILSDKGSIDTLLEGLVEGFPCPLSEESAKKIGKERRNALALVCLNAVTGDSRNVVPALKSLAEGAATEDREYEKRAVLFCLAHHQVAQGDLKGGEATLRPILKEKTKIATPLDDKIDILLAGILSRDPSPKTKTEAVSLYKQVAERRKEGAPVALLSLALMLANQGEKDAAADICIDLLKDYSKTPQSNAGTTLLNAIGISDKIKKRASTAGINVLPQAEGKLIHHVRTIVLPSKTNWEIDPAQLTCGDIVQYNIRCLSRDNCAVIKSFAVSVNPNEPQPPRSKTNEIVFYRAPVLAMPGLSQNFDDALKKR
ncbi:MAG: tetratricopeptide repeat protein [Victivallales bacterium]